MNQPMNFFRPSEVPASQKVEEEVAVFTLFDNAIVAFNEAKTRERYANRPKSLGAGRVGHPLHPVPYERGCERAAYYEYKGYQSEKPFPAKLYRIFSMGHHAEDIVVENLRAAGFTVLTGYTVEGKEELQQYGFSLSPDENGNARYKGFCDGVIIAGPAEVAGVAMKYPMLWENKAINDKKFNKFIADGVERAEGKYYAQVQQYQNFLKLWENPCMFTFLNRETGELRAELIRYNQRHCQEILNRVSRILDAKGPLVLERAASEYEKLPCKWCDFREQCKKDEANRSAALAPNAQIPDQAPSWLKQGD